MAQLDTRSVSLVLTLAVAGCYSVPSVADEMLAGSEASAGETDGYGSGDRPAPLTDGDEDSSDDQGASIPDEGTTGSEPMNTTGVVPDETGDGVLEPAEESGYEAETGDTGDTGELAPPQRVFVTSATFSGDEVVAADQRCQLAANEAELGGNWVAWVSGAVGDAVDRLPADGGPYVLLDAAQTVVAYDIEDLTDGSVHAAIAIDEDGALAGPPVAVWTGTGVTGTTDVDNCLDWTVGTNAQNGRQGRHNQSNGSWTRGFASGCQTVAHLYCFEL